MSAEHVARAPGNGTASSGGRRRRGERRPRLQMLSFWSRGRGLRKQVAGRPAYNENMLRGLGRPCGVYIHSDDLFCFE
jgi:hypothetical protein